MHNISILRWKLERIRKVGRESAGSATQAIATADIQHTLRVTACSGQMIPRTPRLLSTRQTLFDACVRLLESPWNSSTSSLPRNLTHFARVLEREFTLKILSRPNWESLRGSSCGVSCREKFVSTAKR